MKLTFICFNFLFNICSPSNEIFFSCSFSEDFIIDLALEVLTKSIHPGEGEVFLEVKISTWSPLERVLLNGTSFPFTLVPLVFFPISEWIANAKSSAVASFGKDFISPFGVKT